MRDDPEVNVNIEPLSRISHVVLFDTRVTYCAAVIAASIKSDVVRCILIVTIGELCTIMQSTSGKYEEHIACDAMCMMKSSVRMRSGCEPPVMDLRALRCFLESFHCWDDSNVATLSCHS